MGTKVDGLRALVKRMNSSDDAAYTGAVVLDRLDPPEPVTEMLSVADELSRLKLLKSVLDTAAEAVNERLGERNEQLYSLMQSNEMQRFERKGQTFYLTSQSYVQARKELGGLSNPDLISFLEDNGMGDLAKRNVNAQSLRSNVNEWITKHPIEITVDGEQVEGDAQIASALGISENDLDARRAEWHRLDGVVNRSSIPVVGVRKA